MAAAPERKRRPPERSPCSPRPRRWLGVRRGRSPDSGSARSKRSPISHSRGIRPDSLPTSGKSNERRVWWGWADLARLADRSAPEALPVRFGLEAPDRPSDREGRQVRDRPWRPGHTRQAPKSKQAPAKRRRHAKISHAMLGHACPSALSLKIPAHAPSAGRRAYPLTANR
jgi:hypothetical protein